MYGVANADDVPEGVTRFYNKGIQIMNGDASGILATVDVETEAGHVSPMLMGMKLFKNGLSPVAIDYQNYLIGYACEQIDENTKNEIVGIAVRDPNLSQEEIAGI